MLSSQAGFRALADPTRREILVLLKNEAMTIAEVADNFDITRAAVKKHLAILHDSELIIVEPRGRTRVNSFNPHGFAPVLSWFEHLDAFWDDRLDALKAEIEKDLKND